MTGPPTRVVVGGGGAGCYAPAMDRAKASGQESQAFVRLFVLAAPSSVPGVKKVRILLFATIGRYFFPRTFAFLWALSACSFFPNSL